MVERIEAPAADLNRLVQQFIERLTPLIPFDSVGVYQYDPVAETLAPLVLAGDAAIPAISELPVVARSEGVIGQAAARLQPVRADDVGAESRRGWIDPQALSELAVPVQDGDALLGVLLVTHRQPNAYTPQHEQVALAMADHLAVLLKMAQQNRALLGAHNKLVEQMEGHRRELAALQRLATITSATVDLDDMLANALRETAEILDCAGAQILLPDHVHYELALHDHSLYGIVQAWPRRTWALDGPGTVVDVYHTGIAQYENDPPAVDGVDCRNALYCPLNTRQRTLGVLNLVNRRAGDFNDAHLELAEAIARQVAVSISSAQQFAAERSRAEMLTLINHIGQQLYAILNQQALLRRTVDLIRETLLPDAAYVLLLDEGGVMLHLEAQAASDPIFDIAPDYALHISQGVVGRAVRAGEVQIVPDLRIDPDYVPLDAGHRLQSCLTVPLRRSDEGTGEMVIGAIMLLSTQINAFSEIDRDALETLATQVSIALENARLYQEMQRRLLERDIVYQIGQDLTIILNLSELCNAVVQHMNRALNTSACMVELYEEQHRTVRVEADFRAAHHQHPEGPVLTGAYLALDEHYAVAEAIRTRQSVTFYADDPAILDDARDLLNEMGAHSQLVVPMVAGERVIGAVEWTDQQEGRRFSPGDNRDPECAVVHRTGRTRTAVDRSQ
jgi:GAF domain-containing protein